VKFGFGDQGARRAGFRIWRGKVKTELEWRGTKVGQFRFGIEVQAVGEVG